MTSTSTKKISNKCSKRLQIFTTSAQASRKITNRRWKGGRKSGKRSTTRSLSTMRSKYYQSRNSNAKRSSPCTWWLKKASSSSRPKSLYSSSQVASAKMTTYSTRWVVVPWTTRTRVSERPWNAAACFNSPFRRVEWCASAVQYTRLQVKQMKRASIRQRAVLYWMSSPKRKKNKTRVKFCDVFQCQETRW